MEPSPSHVAGRKDIAGHNVKASYRDETLIAHMKMRNGTGTHRATDQRCSLRLPKRSVVDLTQRFLDSRRCLITDGLSSKAIGKYGHRFLGRRSDVAQGQRDRRPFVAIALLK